MDAMGVILQRSGATIPTNGPDKQCALLHIYIIWSTGRTLRVALRICSSGERHGDRDFMLSNYTHCLLRFESGVKHKHN